MEPDALLDPRRAFCIQMFSTSHETGLPGSRSDGISQGESTVGVGMPSNGSSTSGVNGVTSLRLSGPVFES